MDPKVLLQIVCLHGDVDEDISFKCANSKYISLLPVPCSKDCSKFMINESRTRWLHQGISIDIGKDISLSKGFECAQKRLALYQSNIVSDTEMMSDLHDSTSNELDNQLVIRINL